MSAARARPPASRAMRVPPAGRMRANNFTVTLRLGPCTGRRDREAVDVVEQC